MTKATKCFVFLLILSFLFGRLCIPVLAVASDKISKIEPQYSSTQEEDIAKLAPADKKPGYTTWIMVLAGLLLVAGLAGGGGGGGGGSDNPPETQNGDVSVDW